MRGEEEMREQWDRGEGMTAEEGRRRSVEVEMGCLQGPLSIYTVHVSFLSH
jgi:hypothetical protein